MLLWLPRALAHLVLRRCLLVASVVAAFGLGCSFTLVTLTHGGRLSCPEQMQQSPVAPMPQADGAPEANGHFLVVLVMSEPTGVEARNVVRDTWFQSCTQDQTVHCYFVVGTAGLNREAARHLKTENEIQHDLLLLNDVVDSFANLTLKVMKALVWANQEAVAEYVLKCDEDTFVRLPQVLAELKEGDSAPSAASLYWGFFDGRASVQKRGKWQESEWVLCDRYIPYALGGGYVLGSRLLHFITRNRHDLQLFYNEDVSVGTWLAPLKNVRRVHDPRFDTEYKSRGCHNSYLVTHKKRAADMVAMWEQVKWGSERLCPGGREERLRLSYHYDWSAPPSLCCKRWDPAVP